MGKHIFRSESWITDYDTRLNGERRSIVLEGVMFITKEISVIRLNHSGADGLDHRIHISTVRVLC